jgi:hypothetical protein
MHQCLASMLNNQKMRREMTGDFFELSFEPRALVTHTVLYAMKNYAINLPEIGISHLSTAS